MEMHMLLRVCPPWLYPVCTCIILLAHTTSNTPLQHPHATGYTWHRHMHTLQWNEYSGLTCCARMQVTTQCLRRAQQAGSHM
eukprot:2241048-Prorocentrum_lima.AAC.1